MLIGEIDRCKNNHKNSLTTKEGPHISPGFQCLQYCQLRA